MNIESCIDPVTNLPVGFFHIRSESKGGEDLATGILGYPDVQIPASPNFPIGTGITATRYFIKLPFNIDMTDLTNRPCIVTNETQGTNLERRNFDASLEANTFKIFPSSQKRRNIIEVHVDAGAGQPGDLISFDLWVDSSTLRFDDILARDYRLYNVNNIESNYFTEFNLVTLNVNNFNNPYIDFIIKKPILSYFLGFLQKGTISGTNFWYSNTFLYCEQNSDWQLFKNWDVEYATQENDYCHVLTPGKYRVQVTFIKSSSPPSINYDLSLICTGVFGQNAGNIDDIIEIIPQT